MSPEATKINKLARDLDLDPEALFGTCTACGEKNVLIALEEAVEKRAHLRSIAGYVKWRAAKLLGDATRQSEDAALRSRAIDDAAKMRALEKERWERNAADVDAIFARIPEAARAELVPLVLAPLGDGLRERLVHKGLPGSRMFRGLVVDLWVKSGYKVPAPATPAPSRFPPPLP